MKILVGISGSIAAYRSPDFVKELVKMGHEVRVVLTAGAKHFVSSKVLETFSGNPVAGPDPFASELFGTDHIANSRWADAIFVYGASANFLARLAQGIADDFLNLQILAFKGTQVFLAPAMNTAMWENPLVRANVATLEKAGYRIVAPVEGILACGEQGTGHIADHSQMMEALFPASRRSLFRGKRVLISCGPMRTAIDPVRFIQNTSSGEVAIALAKSFRDCGAQVTLLLGPVDSQKKSEADSCAQRVRPFISFEDYEQLLAEEFPRCDVFLSAAAVLDFVAEAHSAKDSRASLAEKSRMEIAIRPTPDLVQAAARAKKPHQKIVGFALETGDLDKARVRALEKLQKKNCDALILNLAENIWGSGPLTQWIFFPDGTSRACEGVHKNELAAQVVASLEILMENRAPLEAELSH
jgi:phosphopantothenoylcysteine decarboxylase/phosphopantothenate--cysteine ligase